MQSVMRRLGFPGMLALLMVLTVVPVLAQDEPPLPEGLVEKSNELPAEPPLPPGIEPARQASVAEEPALPEGLDAPLSPESGAGIPLPGPWIPFDMAGFWEVRLGARTQHDTRQKHLSLAETRLQLKLEKDLDWAIVKVTNDLIVDPVQNEYPVDLEKGRGVMDLREASVSFTPFGFMDVKAGRQVLTWGTGDLLFINDLFPKDWNSFFIGRDMEYLKAPSDAAKISFFAPSANLDVVYTPAFNADRYIDGTRITYWNGLLGRWAGRSARIHDDQPRQWFRDDEIAARLYKTVGGVEWAAYAYDGFWKSPGGTNPANGRARFPDLSVYGASVRGNLFKGVANAEAGYYDSHEDGSGRNPFVKNSEARVLVGYEQEIATNFTAGVQWYFEHIMDYKDYRRTLPAGSRRADEDRHLFTLRLTKLLMNQNLKLSLFTYYSPTDKDAFFMPNLNYKLSDHWSMELGGNLFTGEQRHTFFGQFEDNSNVYMAMRFGF